MALFGFGGIFHKREEEQIERAMRQIVAYNGTHSRNCENCRYWVDSSKTGSKYFGGCTLYGIKVFANKVCDNFVR